MSDAQVATDTPVPATPAAPVAPAPQAQPDGEPKWLPERLDRERRAALKAAGFESVDEARAAKAELDAKRNAQKTAEEKAADAAAKLDAETKRAASLSDVVGEWAGRQMLGLTTEQQAAVKAIAGDDPAAQLKAITALQPTWNKPAPAAPTAPATPPAPLATTVPAGGAPPAATTSEPNHKATYESMKDVNPFAAAAYLQQYRTEIFKPA
jgi:hypothetical protein